MASLAPSSPSMLAAAAEAAALGAAPAAAKSPRPSQVAAALQAQPVAPPCPAEPLPDRRLAAEQRLLAGVLAVLEAGTTPWRREWDGSGGGHHLNLVNGHRYRGVNPILLTLALQARQIHAVGSSELSGLPYWCGFAAARSLGLHPRAGSRAIQILRPHRLQRRGAAPNPATAPGQDGAPACGEAPTSPLVAPWAAASAQDPAASPDAPVRPGSWIRYRPVAVFHVSDLVGEGLEALVTRRHNASKASWRPEAERLEQAELALSRWPVPLELGGAMACYVPTLDRIQLPLRSAFHSPAAFYATWAHEAVHSTGHASRLNRDLSGRMGGDASSERTYAREELVAELGAMLIGDRLEIGSDTANHAAYMSHWIALLQDSPRLLYQVLGEARRAADLVVPDTDEPAAGGDAAA